MQWPWVSRKSAARKRRQIKDSYTAQVERAEAVSAELRRQLQVAQAENRDLNVKLMRVAFGLSPFQEVIGGQVPQQGVEQPEEPATFRVSKSMSPAEIQETFVQEGLHLYGRNMRQIQKHVEMRQREFYGVGQVPSSLSAAEQAAARSATEDLEAAIEEGRRNAGKG